MSEKYWDTIYASKSEKEFSWFQETPEKSLQLISELNLSAGDPIIDIGGGDSRLVDHLLTKGFKDISILDLSSVSLERAKIVSAHNEICFSPCSLWAKSSTGLMARLKSPR